MEATLEAVRREEFGKNAMRRLRREGRIPAIFYGESRDASGKPVAIPIAVDPKSLMRILHSDSGENTLITLKLEGAGDTRVMLKEYQLDPVTHHLLHADLYRVAMDKRVTVTVPIVLRGEAPGWPAGVRCAAAAWVPVPATPVRSSCAGASMGLNHRELGSCWFQSMPAFSP